MDGASIEQIKLLKTISHSELDKRTPGIRRFPGKTPASRVGGGGEKLSFEFDVVQHP